MLKVTPGWSKKERSKSQIFVDLLTNRDLQRHKEKLERIKQTSKVRDMTRNVTQ